VALCAEGSKAILLATKETFRVRRYPGLALPVLVNPTDGAEEEFIVVQLVCGTIIVKGKLHLPVPLLLVPAGTLVAAPLRSPGFFFKQGWSNPNRAGQTSDLGKKWSKKIISVCQSHALGDALQSTLFVNKFRLLLPS
jgi:hypothetical protein